jgi:hypothetical protein
MGALQMLAVEDPVRDALRVARVEHPGADRAPDRVVDGVSRERGRAEQQVRHPQVQPPVLGREGAGGKEQGIARQEGRDDEPRFREDDAEQNPVDPGTVGLQQVGKMPVEVKDELDEL